MKRVTQRDSVPTGRTYWTEEGYLVDNPIVTTVGIFDYPNNPQGSRRQLRLPEEVFESESLSSYEGKPIVITHDAGEIDTENVHDEGIGAMLSPGVRDGDNVRVKTVIHEPDALQGLRELSLCYDFDLDETPGEWNGQPYDSIQRNIRINNLAVVDKARAGNKARLNIDGQDETPKGEQQMTQPKAKPGTKAKQKSRDSEEQPLTVDTLVDALKIVGEGDPPTVVDEDQESGNPLGEDDEETGEDEGGEPESLDEAITMIKELRARVAALEGGASDEGEEATGEDEVEETANDEDEETATDEDETADADDEGAVRSSNADAFDRAVAARLELNKIGERAGIDVSRMDARAAKKAIVRKHNPKMNMDGYSNRELNIVLAMTAQRLPKHKSTDAQRRQMMNGDSAGTAPRSMGETARDAMISRMQRKDGK